MGGQNSKVLSITGISLLSGGLDSILAAKVIMEQGIEVVGITFETPFFNAQKARQATDRIGIPLIVIDFTNEYLVMLRAPRYGYGKNMNPCIDCHTLMLKKAGEKMEELGADFLFTGEVLGQRPMSQTKQSLHIASKRSGYEELILRPMSAKLLPETIPEKEGTVDRERLLDIEGRSRKRQIAMAGEYGIIEYSNPGGGCLLTDPMFSRRLKDLFHYHPDFKVRDLELLKAGRHLRLDEETKIIVGRNEKDNDAIEGLVENDDVVVTMGDVPGPITLIPYGCNEEKLHKAATICAMYSDAPNNEKATAHCSRGDTVKFIEVTAEKMDEVQKLMI